MVAPSLKEEKGSSSEVMEGRETIRARLLTEERLHESGVSKNETIFGSCYSKKKVLRRKARKMRASTSALQLNDVVQGRTDVCVPFPDSEIAFGDSVCPVVISLSTGPGTKTLPSSRVTW